VLGAGHVGKERECSVGRVPVAVCIGLQRRITVSRIGGAGREAEEGILNLRCIFAGIPSIWRRVNPESFRSKTRKADERNSDNCKLDCFDDCFHRCFFVLLMFKDRRSPLNAQHPTLNGAAASSTMTARETRRAAAWLQFLSSCFESLAVPSPRISHPLGGGKHVVYAASHPLQPDSFI